MSQENEKGVGWDSAYRAHDKDSLWGDAPIPPFDGVVSLLKARGVRSVADVGTGDGRNLAGLADAGFFCAGVDISATALERAGRRLAHRDRVAHLIVGDAGRLPFADASLDAVTCFDMFGQVAEPAAILAEFGRVLRPHGVLALNAFTTDDSEFGVGEAVAPRLFRYRDTLFRFFEEQELRALLGGFRLLSFTKEAWVDPPHGDFRPYSHRHENWVVVAER